MSPSDYCNKNNRLWSTNIIYCYCLLINGHCVGFTCIFIATRKLRDDGWGRRTLPCYLQPAIIDQQRFTSCCSLSYFCSVWFHRYKNVLQIKNKCDGNDQICFCIFFFGQLMFVCKTCVGDGSDILSATALEQTK